MLTNYGFKLRYLLGRFLVISVAFMVGFGLLYWLLVLRWELVYLTREQQFFGYAALAGVVVFLGLRSRVNLFHRDLDDRWITLFYLAPAAALTFGALATAQLLTAATGQLAALEQPAEALRQPTARFYTLRQAYFHKRGSGAETVVTPTGRNNKELRLEVYVACPVLATAADTATRQAVLWLAWHQSETISANLSTPEKEARYRQFLASCESQFQAADLAHYAYLARITDADDQRPLTVAVSRSSYGSASTAALILQPQTEPFVLRTQAPLRSLGWSLGLGWAMYAVMLLFPTLSFTRVEEWQAGQRPTSLLAELMPYVLPAPGYVATPLLVGLLIVVYLLMVAAGLGVVNFRAADLLRWGATYGPAIEASQWWRLLSSSLLHGGLLHLLYNVFSLGLISWLLEPAIGTWRLFALYVLSAVAASLTSVWWQPTTVSVGASGAIFGLFGAAIALGLSKRTPEDTRGILVFLPLLYGGLSLLLGFVIPGTDNAAHLGGLACGMIAGVLLLLTFPRASNRH